MNSQIIKVTKPLVFTALIAALVFGVSHQSYAQDNFFDASLEDEIFMMKGDLVTIKANIVTRLSLTNPDVADIVDADEEEVLLIAQEQGQTTLFIWDEDGKRAVTIYVSDEDLEIIKSRVNKLLRDAGLLAVRAKVNEEEGKVVLIGEVKKDDRDNFEKIAGPFDDYLLDLTVEEEIKDLIEVNVQISEVSVSSLRDVGFEWSEGGGGDGLTISYEETLPLLDGSFGDLFQVGDFTRIQQFNFIVNALEQRGEAKVLAKPKVVVVNGEEATFLVGGEIPIRTTTSTDGATQENVEFKDYGISVSVTPTIINEKIQIELNVEDSDIDSANSVGQDTAFITRTAQTMLYLNDNQPVVLAGFLRKNRNEIVKKVPFLGDVPVLGALFRNRSNPTANVDTELVISLTPTILEKNRKKFYDQKPKLTTKKGFGTYSTPKRVNPNFISGIPQEMSSYVRAVQQKISQSILYPPEAKNYGWEGTVKVAMLILNDGTLAYALVKDSSGHELFDEHALDMARTSAPFEPFPTNADLQELNITIPIVYSLNK